MEVDLRSESIEPQNDDRSWVYESFGHPNGRAIVIGSLWIWLTDEQAELVRHYFENT